MNDQDKCAAPSDVDCCTDCGEPLDACEAAFAEEFNEALDTIYTQAFFEEEIQEFARQHPGKQLEFETLVVARVINTDCAAAVTYFGPTVDSSDPELFY